MSKTLWALLFSFYFFLSQRNASPFGAHAFDVGRSRASHEQERVSNDLRLQLWAKALFSSLGGVPLR